MSMLTLLRIITILLSMLSAFVQAEEGINNSKKLDIAGPPELENKCGNCPCDNPCNPLPSPPPPSPPPPPPKVQPPPTNYCPPPPPPPSQPSGGGGGGQNPPNPPYIYINAPPGSVYPVNPSYTSHGFRSFSVGTFTFLISTILWLQLFSF